MGQELKLSMEGSKRSVTFTHINQRSRGTRREGFNKNNSWTKNGADVI